MISSSVYGFKEELRQLAGYLDTTGYEVICSALGKMKTSSKKNFIEDCLQRSVIAICFLV